MILIGDRGIPDRYRFMNGYFGHTIKLPNKSGELVYCQFHMISDQGIRLLTNEEASTKFPDYAQKGLYEAIEWGEYPSWTLKVQTTKALEIEDPLGKQHINVFNPTHI